MLQFVAGLVCVHSVGSPGCISWLPLHRLWVSRRLLLSQLCPNLMGELVQVFVHALHAEPLRVEQTTVLAGERKRLCIQSSFFNLHFTPKGFFVFRILVIFTTYTICPCSSTLCNCACNQ